MQSIIIKLSKQVLSRIVEDIKAKTSFNLWKNSDSVIKWFENLENKGELKFYSLILLITTVVFLKSSLLQLWNGQKILQI